MAVWFRPEKASRLPGRSTDVRPGHAQLPPPELLVGGVEQEWPKFQVVVPRHGGRVPVRTETKPLHTVTRGNLNRSALAANREGP